MKNFQLNRHLCNAKLTECLSTKLVLAKVDREKLKMASVNFIVKDLRPYFAIQCEGLLDLCNACMEFGQKYRRASRDDLVQTLPTRNTVKDAVTREAGLVRKTIGDLLRRAIVSGGIAATTDTWTDDYQHTTYIAVVAHISVRENNDVTYHRFVLSTSEVTELVKTGKFKF